MKNKTMTSNLTPKYRKNIKNKKLTCVFQPVVVLVTIEPFIQPLNLHAPTHPLPLSGSFVERGALEAACKVAVVDVEVARIAQVPQYFVPGLFCGKKF